MRGYGETHHSEDRFHKFLLDGGSYGALAIYRTFTPFNRRTYRRLTTNKSRARRANRAACVVEAD